MSVIKTSRLLPFRENVSVYCVNPTTFIHNAMWKNDILRVITSYVQVIPNDSGISILYKSENLVIAYVASQCN